MAANRTLGASSRDSTRRASRTVHSTGGFGQAMSHCAAADFRKPMSKPALCATSTAPRQNSRNIGSTASIAGASCTIAVVIPVSRTIWGGMSRRGSTSVANSPRITPPRTLTAPISVIASHGPPAAPGRARPPVVSRSTTTNVVARSDTSKSPPDGSTSVKLNCTASLRPTRHTLGLGPDRLTRRSRHCRPVRPTRPTDLSVAGSSVRGRTHREDTEHGTDTPTRRSGRTRGRRRHRLRRLCCPRSRMPGLRRQRPARDAGDIAGRRAGGAWRYWPRRAWHPGCGWCRYTITPSPVWPEPHVAVYRIQGHSLLNLGLLLDNADAVS